MLIKKIKIGLLGALLIILFPQPVLAVCPVCTVAIGVGVGLSRWLGISDVISGLWVGGLILSSSIWLSTWFHKRHIKIYHYRWQTLIIAMLFYVLTFWSLALTRVMTDKLVFGSAIGSVIFLMAVWLDKYLRKTNEGKVKFYYQKVIIPVGLLLIFSLIFYLVKA